MIDESTQMRVLWIIIIVCLLGVFVFWTLWMIDMMTSQKIGEKEVLCYDRYGNEIIGQVCVDEIYCGVIGEFFGECER